MTGKWPVVFMLTVVVLCAIITAAGVYATGTMRAADAELIQRQRFELVDAEGKVRAILGFHADTGAPVLCLNHPTGIPCIALGLAEENGRPGLVFYGTEGRGRAALSLTDAPAENFCCVNLQTSQVVWVIPSAAARPD